MHPYVLAAIGGALIGLSAVMLMAFSGRLAGISGIVGGLMPPKPADDWTWRVAFVVGLILAPLVLAGFTGDTRIGAPTVGPLLLIVAGLLVGGGTMLGSGCTSGHGVCGVSRLSPRSIAATITFIAAGMITVFVVRHVM